MKTEPIQAGAQKPISPSAETPVAPMDNHDQTQNYLSRPTVIGWWWLRFPSDHPPLWVPVMVDEVEQDFGGGLRCLEYQMRDNGNPEHTWKGEWSGPISEPSVPDANAANTPPVSPKSEAQPLLGAKWKPCKWRIVGAQDSMREISIDLVANADGPDRFAIRKAGAVLSKDNTWEYEPMPSNRDQAFYDRCRYSTFQDAEAAISKATGADK